MATVSTTDYLAELYVDELRARGLRVHEAVQALDAYRRDHGRAALIVAQHSFRRRREIASDILRVAGRL